MVEGLWPLLGEAVTQAGCCWVTGSVVCATNSHVGILNPSNQSVTLYRNRVFIGLKGGH